MNDYEYKEGQQIAKLFFTDAQVISAGDDISIVVVMENGMYCGIPHAAVFMKEVLHQKFCLHSIEGVEFLQPQEEVE